MQTVGRRQLFGIIIEHIKRKALVSVIVMCHDPLYIGAFISDELSVGRELQLELKYTAEKPVLFALARYKVAEGINAECLLLAIPVDPLGGLKDMGMGTYN